jgi:phosphatidylglycerol:prolipoprotein diacylglycerol transferase
MDIVEFPGLGLRIPVKREAVENLFGIEGFDIYWYGIIIALGFLLAVVLGMRDSRKLGLEPDNVIDLVLYAAPVAIITSRLYYVAFSCRFSELLSRTFLLRRESYTGGILPHQVFFFS